MAKVPDVRGVHVECGKTRTINAYDEDGNPVEYRIQAGARRAGPVGGGRLDSGGGAVVDSGGGIGGGSSRGGSGDSGDNLIPDLTGGIYAALVGVGGRSSLDPGLDIVVNQSVLPELRADHHVQAVVWRGHVSGRRVTLDLPEGFAHRSGDDMTFVIGMD